MRKRNLEESEEDETEQTKSEKDKTLRFIYSGGVIDDEIVSVDEF